MGIKFEIDVPSGQEEAFLEHVAAFEGAQIIYDGTDVARERARLQSRIDALRNPVEEEMVGPIKKAYEKLFTDTYFRGRSSAFGSVSVHADSVDDTMVLQETMHGIFTQTDNYMRPKIAAAIIERYGLVTGVPKRLADVGGALEHSGNWALENVHMGIRILRSDQSIRAVLQARFVEVPNIPPLRVV